MAKTKLYLKTMIETGQSFRIRDPRSHRFLPNFDIILFPNDPTEVEEKYAKLLLKQDPHLVSTEPYSPENDIRVQIREDAKKKQPVFEDEQPEDPAARAAANERFRYRDKDEYGEDFSKLSPKEEKKVEQTEEVEAEDIGFKKPVDSTLDDAVLDYADPLQKLGNMRPEIFENLKLVDLKEIITSLDGDTSVRSKAEAKNRGASTR